MKYSDIWDTLPFACILSDIKGSIIDINSAGEVFLNIARNTIIMKPIQQYLRVDFDLLGCFQNFPNSASRSKFKDISITVNTTTIITDLWIVLLENEFLLVFHPTDDNSLNNILLTESASKSVVGMAEMLAHEIKNPIAGIISAAQLLEMTLSSDDRKLTKLIKDETKRILDLLKQFDKFGDLRKPELKAVNIHHVIKKSIKICKISLIKNVLIEENYDPSLPDIFVDQIQLEQVFVNLIENSINALKDHHNGKITFRTFYEKGLFFKTEEGVKNELPLHIQIEDNGSGIPESLIDKIFDPFITGSVNGTGLGLSLVSKVILSHNGLIKCSRINDLTIFKISLPIM